MIEFTESELIVIIAITIIYTILGVRFTDRHVIPVGLWEHFQQIIVILIWPFVAIILSFY
jgi:hypothetical protein